MKMMLHCCCGPCSTYSLESLRNEGFKVYGHFYNPNIHPYKEFELRKKSFEKFASSMAFDVKIEEEYGLYTFLDEVMSAYKVRSLRCARCYHMRLLKTAILAKDMGFDCFSTTLTISPYQDHETIKQAGEDISKEVGVKFEYRDFRAGYKSSIDKSKQMELYRQQYCGCIFSEKERYLPDK